MLQIHWNQMPPSIRMANAIVALFVFTIQNFISTASLLHAVL